MSLAQQIQSRKQAVDVAPVPEVRKFTPPPINQDPRPDLQEDHHLWNRLLTLSCSVPDIKKATDLVGVLHGMRCGGTRLRKGQNGGYVLRPDIDPTGCTAWESQQAYEEVRDRYLKPHSASLKVVLQFLNREVG